MAGKIDVFDQGYRDRIHEATVKAIIEATRDPATNVAALRNHEICDALLDIQAMLLATSKEAGSPTKIRETAEQFAKKLRQRIGAFKVEFDRGNSPFAAVLHTDDMQ